MKLKPKHFQFSWGRYFRFNQKVERVSWSRELETVFDKRGSDNVLPYGLGRSYGDSCLNENGILLDVSGLNRFLGFNRETGVVRCEAGVSLDEILSLAVPSGWFLPVTPGTKQVTIGGAVANDVHGKNHHVAGTIGCHILQFELLSSDGSRKICSPKENPELFGATIGGIGLTGIITWVDLQLKKITTSKIDVENIKIANLDEFFKVSDDSDENFEYTVCWVDCVAKGKDLGRGIFMRGNHAEGKGAESELTVPNPDGLKPTFPINAPNFLLNNLSIKAFNFLYYNKQFSAKSRAKVHYNGFFYPLDVAEGWNKLYGKRGFFQYQFIVPEDKTDALQKIFQIIADSGNGSFLAVLKKFGTPESPGMLSFPRPGYTLALDFANLGEKTLKLFRELDEIVISNGGRLYPAKDSVMSIETFRASYPNWEEFSKFIDPVFSSSFWRRVNGK